MRNGVQGRSGGDAGEGRMMRGRKFAAQELQLMLLALLERQPSHGYELIKALQSQSNGYYSPSPGMVYPALTSLEVLGYVAAQVHGNRKRYHVSDIGRAYLGSQRERSETLFRGLRHVGRKMAWMQQAWDDETAVQSTADATGWLPEFVQARHALKQALMHSTDATHEEQRRIAGILKRAVTDILRDGVPASCND